MDLSGSAIDALTFSAVLWGFSPSLLLAVVVRFFTGVIFI